MRLLELTFLDLQEREERIAGEVGFCLLAVDQLHLKDENKISAALIRRKERG